MEASEAERLPRQSTRGAAGLSPPKQMVKGNTGLLLPVDREQLTWLRLNPDPCGYPYVVGPSAAL